MTTNDELRKIMEGSREQILRLFFKQSEVVDIKEPLKKEIQAILNKRELPYNLQTLKAMEEGMSLFSAGMDFKSAEDMGKPEYRNSFISLMAIQYFIIEEEDKVKEALSNVK